MTSVWSFSRDEFPETVHALMAMWGGFDPPCGADDSGLEKRLELDFRGAVPLGAVPVSAFASVLARVDEPLEASEAAAHILTLKFRRTLVVVTARQLVLSAASSVLLHATLRPLLELYEAIGVGVEWASFMRMNTRSPWTATGEMCDVMAQEYAALKSAFPSGNSYLTGSVDREHLFHFVYDAIDRSAAGVEERDVQINVYMPNVKMSKCASGGSTNSMQVIAPLGSAVYETLRITTDSDASVFASFETNVLLGGRLQELLLQFSPDRFTVVVLQDRHCSSMLLRNVLEQMRDYSVLSTVSNHFADGYAYHLYVLVREA